MTDLDIAKEKRRRINQLNYLKNRDRILAKRKQKKITQPNPPKVELSPPPLSAVKTPKISKKRFILSVIGEIIFLQTLIMMMVFFLTKEAAAFYSMEGGEFNGWLKALIGEGIFSVIAVICALPNKKIWVKLAYQFFFILIMVFQIWATSGRPVSLAYAQINSNSENNKILNRMESELVSKNKIRDELISRGRIKSVLQISDEISKIHYSLNSLQSEMKIQTVPKAAQNNLEINVAFRILVMLGSLICISRVSELIRNREYLQR